MKASINVVMLLLSVGLAGAAQVQSTSTPNTPVSRAVQLLKGMVMKTEMMQKMEQGLFDKYVCWAKTIINQKTASNVEAQARIDELETYIADIDAGRIDFTTERVDLEKAIEGLKEEIQTADSLREQENANFLAAEDEMEMAIAALDKAIKVLGTATDKHKTGVFLAQREEVKDGLNFAAATREAATLQRAVKLGKQVLGAGDAVFLQRLLTGEVPTWNWKKLNRKATFKMSYKARSFKIQEVLQNMQGTFTENLADARQAEKDAKALYDKLMKSKGAELLSTQNSLDKMTAESTARGQTKQESQDEVDDLKKQVSNDKRFIKQAQDALKEKTGQWKERKTLRAEELAAMSEAIAILNNDDARDNMKRSFKSQGYAFLQEVMSSHALRARQAAALLNKAAHKSGDKALSALATAVAKATPLTDNSPFAAVIGAINNMIALLQGEEESDLAAKEECEKNRMDDTRDAIVQARQIDEKTESIDALRAEIVEIKKDIEETIEKIAQTRQELKDATELREDENREWTTSDKDDSDAYDTIVSAKDVLTKFYADNMLTPALVQVPGEAPPPPPSTWETIDDYGKQGAFGRKAIITMLDGIIEDVQKDRTAAKAEEDKAAAEFVTFKAEALAQIGALDKARLGLIKTQGEKEDDVSDDKAARSKMMTALDGTMATVKDAEGGCDYITINYPIKLTNRQIELDGLTKAKAILVGGTFDSGPDAARALVPGDALVQKSK